MQKNKESIKTNCFNIRRNIEMRTANNQVLCNSLNSLAQTTRKSKGRKKSENRNRPRSWGGSSKLYPGRGDRFSAANA